MIRNWKEDGDVEKLFVAFTTIGKKDAIQWDVDLSEMKTQREVNSFLFDERLCRLATEPKREGYQSVYGVYAICRHTVKKKNV